MSFSVDGKVYKVVQWFDESTKQGKSELLDIFEVTSPEPIRMMEISPKVWIIWFYYLNKWLVYIVLIMFLFLNSTSPFTPHRITGSVKSIWSCVMDVTTIACAAYEIHTAAGIKNPTLVNLTLMGN